MEKTLKKRYTASLSEEGQTLIGCFNALPAEEQSLIVDILYDALYDRNLRLVLAARIVQQAKEETEQALRRTEDLEQQCRELEKRPRSLDALYGSIPKEERKEYKKEITRELIYRDMTRNLNSIREENALLKQKLRQYGTIV